MHTLFECILRYEKGAVAVGVAVDVRGHDGREVPVVCSGVNVVQGGVLQTILSLECRHLGRHQSSGCHSIGSCYHNSEDKKYLLERLWILDGKGTLPKSTIALFVTCLYFNSSGIVYVLFKSVNGTTVQAHQAKFIWTSQDLNL